MTPETLAHVRADVQTAMVENRYDDPALLPDLVMFLLDQLGQVATVDHHPVSCSCWACSTDMWTTGVGALVSDLIEKAGLRATSKIPFAEWRTPADIAGVAGTIDPDWREHP